MVAWTGFSNPATNFNQTDFATFNDTAAGATMVNLTTTLLPTTVAVSNHTRTCTSNGSGYLSGPAGIFYGSGPSEGRARSMC